MDKWVKDMGLFTGRIQLVIMHNNYYFDMETK